MLNRLWNRYDTAIWVRVIGTVLTTVTSFMLRPFLLLYLYNQLNGSLLLSTLIIGLQPLSGLITNLWSGGLTDRYGRKPLMLISLVIQSATMIGYMFATEAWHFAVLTFINGMGGSLFFPAANAQVSDVVAENRRAEVFALLHTALNVGAAVGPLIGVVLFKTNPALVFAISAIALALYFGLVLFTVPETLPKHLRKQKDSSGQRTAAPKLKFREHKTLLWMTLLAVPITMLYSQVETTLPLHLKDHFDNFEQVYATLLTINGTIVIILQMLIAKRTENLRTAQVVFVAYLFFAFVGVGYGFASSMVVLIMAEVSFTIGEMLSFPHINKAVSMIAPEEFRGRYFSIYGLSWGVGRSIGPTIGGFILERAGGLTLFLSLTVLLAFTGVFQSRLIRRSSHELAVKASTSTAVEVG